MVQCFAPVSIPRPKQVGDIDKNDRIMVPCGKCEACRLRQIEHWKYRAIYECKVAENAYFITLTYNDEYIPYDEETGTAVLRKNDYKLFLKRLRHYLYSFNGVYNADNKLKMKYILCGEYGSRNTRPHYHAILINVPWNGNMSNHIEYVMDKCELAWNKGYVYIGRVEPGAVDYVCSYVLGKHNWNHPYQPPFMVASNGIGLSYVEMFKDWHLQNPEARLSMQIGGRQVTMPRYIVDKIFDEEKKELLTFKKKQALEELRQKEYEEVQKCDDKLVAWHLQQQGKAAKYFAEKKSKRYHVSYKK